VRLRPADVGLRQPHPAAGHPAAAIQVSEHDGGRIGIGHDHLRDQRGEDRQELRAGQVASGGGKLDRQDVEREAQIFEAERGLVDHRPRTEKPPVQARAAEAVQIRLMGPVGLEGGQLDAAAPGGVEVEHRRAREEPADRLLLDGKRLHAGDDPVDEGHERFAVANVPCAIDDGVLAPDEIERHRGVQVAPVQGHPGAVFGRQLRRVANEHSDRVPGGERLPQHVAAERAGRAQDEDTGHQTPPCGTGVSGSASGDNT